MPSPAETLARQRTRALAPRDFQDAAEVLDREARRTMERHQEAWKRGTGTPQQRATSLQNAPARGVLVPADLYVLARFTPGADGGRPWAIELDATGRLAVYGPHRRPLWGRSSATLTRPRAGTGRSGRRPLTGARPRT